MKKSALVFLAILLTIPVLANAQTIVFPQYKREALVNPYVYYPYTLKNLTNSPVVVYVYWTKNYSLKYELDRNEQTVDVMLPLGAEIKVKAYIQKGDNKGTHTEETGAYYFVSYKPVFERGWLIGYKP